MCLLAGGRALATGLPAGQPIAPGVTAASASGNNTAWHAEPATYGVKTIPDQRFTMSDGVVLSGNVLYPTLPDGALAPGPFPVLINEGPYGKDTVGAAAGILGTANEQGPEPYLVERGYIEMIVDVRGTGSSGGSWSFNGPREQQDSVTLIHDAATLPHSDGKVGMFGESYLGIDQMFAAAAVGRNSPLKAIFPIITANDWYRDMMNMGGIPNVEIDTSYLGAITLALNAANPVADAVLNPSNAVGDLSTAADRVGQALGYNLPTMVSDAEGNLAYDDNYWQQRSVQELLAKVVANGVPAYLVGGEHDVFQRGEPLNYAALQNLHDGRSATAPMIPGQKVTGRYQLLDGPWTHVQAAFTVDYRPLMLEWFDTWLKGEHTGMGNTPTPLHYYDLGTGQYVETTTYPFSGTKPTTYYFGGHGNSGALSTNDGTLSTSRPTSRRSDPIVWSPVGSPCSQNTDQWGFGFVSTGDAISGAPPVCLDSDNTTELGPWALTYTTSPMTKPTRIAGPLSATIYASANTTDTEFVVNLEDVSPSGNAVPLTEGGLLGKFRAVNPSRSWTAPNGHYLMPYHDFTESSTVPVTPGTVTRYDIEIYPTLATIEPGHRLRVTLTTVQSPSLMPSASDVRQLVGGEYEIERSPAASSSIELPLVTSAR